MNRQHAIFILTLLTCNISCKNEIKSIDLKAGKNLFYKFQADSFELYNSNPKMTTEKKNLKFILYGSKVLQEKAMDSISASSFCAIDLFRNLSSKTLNDIDGISIIFTENNTIVKPNNTFYYSIKDLIIINKSATVINSFFNCRIRIDCQSQSNYIDTSIINIDSINVQLRYLYQYIPTPILSFSCKEEKYVLRNNSVHDCLLFTVQIADRNNGKALYLYVITYKNEYENKIISIQNYQ